MRLFAPKPFSLRRPKPYEFKRKRNSGRRRQPNYYKVNGESMPGVPDDSYSKEYRSFWQKMYNPAFQYYTDTKSPNPEQIARNSAWRACNLYLENPKQELLAGFDYDDDPIWMGEREVLYDPERIVSLGRSLEFTYYGEKEELTTSRFTEPGLPHLLWSKDLRTLYVFPSLKMPQECRPELIDPDQAAEYKKWAARPPKCGTEVHIPDMDVNVIGSLDTTVYRSDKWEDEPNPEPDLKGSAEYLHQHDDGVAILKNGKKAMCAYGGRLTVEPGGINH